MNVTITGVSGFVGQNLVPYLTKKNISITALHRSQLANLDSYDFSNQSVVIHLAGKAHDLEGSASADDYYLINSELTKSLYNAFLKSAAKKFIFFSSVKAAADNLDEILAEDYISNPKTHYGKSKLQAEQYIISQPLPADKSFFILRPCMIHGAGNKGNLNLLYKFVAKNIPYPLGAFKNKRSYLSIENLCFTISELIKSETISSGIYNISDDDALSTNEVVDILASALNRKAKILKISPFLIRILAKIGDHFKLPLNTERLKKLTENYIVSNLKIKSALGVELPTSAKEGLLTTVQSFKSK